MTALLLLYCSSFVSAFHPFSDMQLFDSGKTQETKLSLFSTNKKCGTLRGFVSVEPQRVLFCFSVIFLRLQFIQIEMYDLSQANKSPFQVFFARAS